MSDAIRMTTTRQDEIIALVRRGVLKTHAAASVRISRSTLGRWLKLGRDNIRAYEAGKVSDYDDYGLFALELAAAEAETDAAAAQCLAGAARADPKYAEKWLRRREWSNARVGWRGQQPLGEAARAAPGAEDYDNVREQVLSHLLGRT